MVHIFKQIRLYFIVKKVLVQFIKNPISCKELKLFVGNSTVEQIDNYRLMHFSFKNINFVVMHTYKEDTLVSVDLYINGDVPERIYEVEIDND